MKIYIIGAGISGLLSAYYLVKSGKRVEIFERSSRAGGLIRTFYSPYGPLENAAGSIVNSFEVQTLFDELGIGAAIQGARAHSRYIYRDFPRRWPLNLNQSLRLFYGAAKLSLTEKKGLDQDLSVRQWGHKYLGKSATELLLETALQGVYAGDCARMSASLVLGPVLNRKKTPFNKTRFKGSAMPVGGMGKLISALTVWLENNGVRINYSSEIVAKDIDSYKPWLIATPAPVAGKLMHGLDIGGGDELAKHEMLDLTSVHLIFENSPLPFEGVGCLLPKSEGFSSLGVLTGMSAFPDQFSKPVERWFIGGALSAINVGSINDQALVDMVLADRKKLTGSQADPVAAHVFSNPQSLPHFTHMLADIRKRLSLPENLYLVGNYTGGIGLTSIISQCQQLPGKIKN